MIFKYLLTLLLLFLAPDSTALAPVMGDDDTLECSDAYYWEGDINYYWWESCLFEFSGYNDDTTVPRADHQALFERVWSDYMGDAPRPRLRRGQAAVEEVCEPFDDGTYPLGCSATSYEPCGMWRMCLVPDTIAVIDNSPRTLLHEVAHTIYDISTWHPHWGRAVEGSYLGTDGHPFGFRCFLLDIYHHYTGQVADDAYKMLRSVCVSMGESD